MINENILNSTVFNDNEILQDTILWEEISSFSSEYKGKYSFKTKLGSIFNFNTIVWDCRGNDSRKYGNTLDDHNIEDMADIDIIKYETPLRNGGIIQNQRFIEKIFHIKITLYSNTIENLQKEIQAIKTAFHSWGELYKKEYNRESYINVKLEWGVKVWKILLSGTQIEFDFISLDPFFIQRNGTTKFYENQTEPIDGTLVINDSEYPPILTTIIQFWNTTWVNNIKLELNGYELEVNETIPNNAILIFNGEENKVTLNGTEIKWYKGQFLPFPLGVPGTFKINYNGTLDTYNTYILYDKIIL